MKLGFHFHEIIAKQPCHCQHIKAMIPRVHINWEPFFLYLFIATCTSSTAPIAINKEEWKSKELEKIDH